MGSCRTVPVVKWENEFSVTKPTACRRVSLLKLDRSCNVNNLKANGPLIVSGQAAIVIGTGGMTRVLFCDRGRGFLERRRMPCVVRRYEV